MKNYLFIALFFFAYSISFSQSFNVAEHAGKTKTFNIVGINNKSYYLEVSTPMQYCCYDEVHLIGHDGNGNEILNSQIAVGSWMNYARVAVTEKKTLLMYVGTPMVGCDYGGIKFQVMELDTLGNLLWTLNIAPNCRVDALLPRTNGINILLSADTLYRLNGSGQVLSRHKANYGGNPNTMTNVINSTCVLNNGNILLSYGSSTLKEIDTLGNAINTTTINPITELNQVATGEIYGISSGNLVKLSLTSYSLLATSSFSNFSPSAYCYKNDSIFVVGNEANLVPKYILLDAAFNILHQSISNLEQVQCTGITVDNSKTLKILSYGSSDSHIETSHTFSGYFHTEILGNLNGTKDIGITNVEIDSVRIQPLTAGLSQYNYNMIARAKVTVKNFGNTPIKNFKLNYYSLYVSFSYCFVGINEYHEVELQPEDTATVVTGFFNSPFALWNSSTYTANICMYTSVPDSMNDYETSNNTKCAFKVLYGVGIKEYSRDNELKIFPNPSNGGVNIHSEQAITKFEVFDYSGKQVGLYTPNKEKFELKENMLSEGLYIFKITTSNYTVVRKVVIE